MRLSDTWYMAWRNALRMIKEGRQVYQTIAALSQAEYVMALALEAVHERTQ